MSYCFVFTEHVSRRSVILENLKKQFINISNKYFIFLIYRDGMNVTLGGKKEGFLNCYLFHFC